jgi:apolipoprotein N-acyltransferase
MKSAEITPPAWRRSTLAIALVGSALMWASLPNDVLRPLGSLGWLGWIAPVPWLLLVRMNTLPGWRPYRALYLAGLAFWLPSIYWLSLPHWAVIPLWIALAIYLAVYLPLFVALSRVAVHRFSVPLWLAAPIVWTGLELGRAHVMTGFLMASLAHTQVKWTTLIQISDLVGEYGVDFVLMLTAACIATLLHLAAPGLRHDSEKPQSEIRNPKSILLRGLAAIIPAAVVLTATLVYGHLRLAHSYALKEKASQAGPRVALIQGNILADWKGDEEKRNQIMNEYVRLSKKAIAEAGKTGDSRMPDLIVWPETMYRNPLREFEPGFQLPTDVKTTTDEITAGDRRELHSLAASLGAPLLIGIDRWHILRSGGTPDNSPVIRAYNSAVLVEPDSTVVTTYDKIHLVMFGEYVPFAHWLPMLNRLSSLTGSVEAGTEPVAMCSHGRCYVPNICYETAIPHVIRHAVATLEDKGNHPDALVNLTNDAWYWGSSGLEMHLDCGMFRAVETRLPLVIAANGGISAHIDSLGRIRAQSPRAQSDVIVADVEPGHLQSWYVRHGDWFSGVCLACCIVLAAAGWKEKKQ